MITLQANSPKNRINKRDILISVVYAFGTGFLVITGTSLEHLILPTKVEFIMGIKSGGGAMVMCLIRHYKQAANQC